MKNMLKKFSVAIFTLIFAIVGIFAISPTQTANAATCLSDATGINQLLSFPRWNRGMCKEPENTSDELMDFANKSLFTDIILPIALNILDIALRLAAIMAVGFVIYGGFRYVISRGAPEETKKALDTILKAVIGAVIAMVAAIVVGFIVGRLSA